MKSVLSGERRGAHRHDPFTKEQFGVVIGKVAVADANGRIKSACLDVGIALEEPQPNVERMQGCAQRLESGNEPELGDTGMGGEHERTAVVGELTNTGVDPVESGGDMAVEGLTGVGQLTAIRGTGEKVPTQTAFEGPDLSGDRWLGHAEFAGGRREAAQAGGGIEHGKAMESTDLLRHQTCHAVRLWQTDRKGAVERDAPTSELWHDAA